MATPYTVTPDTPVREVIRQMIKGQLGSVLIVDKADREKLLGIFTERDILTQFESLALPGGPDRPIRSVMTKDVKSIDVSKVKYAAAMMIQNNFRHLPITEKTKDNKTRLVGVISMRDLLKRVQTHVLEKMLSHSLGVDQEKAKGRATGDRPISGLVGVLSMDWAFRKLLGQAFSGIPGVSFKRVSIAELPERSGDLRHLSRYSFLLIDLDDWRGKSWPNLLTALSKENEGPKVMIFISPQKYETKVLNALQGLTSSKRFSVFAKPIDYFSLVQTIEVATAR